jgi:hypothetical protein
MAMNKCSTVADSAGSSYLHTSGKHRMLRHQQLQQEDHDSRRASSRGIIPKAKVKTIKMTFVIVFGEFLIARHQKLTKLVHYVLVSLFWFYHTNEKSIINELKEGTQILYHGKYNIGESRICICAKIHSMATRGKWKKDSILFYVGYSHLSNYEVILNCFATIFV